MVVALVLAQLLAANGGAAARAKSLTELGNEEFAHGHYAAAAREYQEADRLAPKAALLLKIAKSHEKNGELTKAADDYRAFLRRAPSAPNRAMVKRELARVEKLRRKRKDSLALVPLSKPSNPLALVPLSPPANPLTIEPLTQPPPASPPAAGPEVAEGPPASPPVAAAVAEAPHKSIAPIIATTAGAIAVAGAAGCGYWGGWGLDALQSAQHYQSLALSPTQKAAYNGEIGQLQVQAGVWLSAAGVLAATGVYLLIAGPSWGVASETGAVSAAPMPGGGGLVWSGTFQ
jgi:tetratricopeptide (TPR) repeat protein